MVIKSSTALRNDYEPISALAHETREPAHITKNREGDVAVMSVEAPEEMREGLDQRSRVLEAEARRLAGEPSYGVDEVRSMLRERYLLAEA